jgi:hypothetical protein
MNEAKKKRVQGQEGTEISGSGNEKKDADHYVDGSS